MLATERGLGLATLDSILGFGNGTIGKWDKFNPSADKLKIVADYFGVTVDFLLTGEQKEPLSRAVTDDDIKFALFGGDAEITDEQFDEVKRFAQFVKERNGNH